MSDSVRTSEPVLNREKLLDHVCESTELLREIADMFFGKFPGQMSETLSAIETGDSNRVREMGHLIKGSLSNFHAPAAVAAALQLEVCGRENQLEEAESAVIQLQQEVGRVSDVLDELC